MLQATITKDNTMSYPYSIHFDETDVGISYIPLNVGTQEQMYASEVFCGGTKDRPMILHFDSGTEEEAPDWYLENITAFHPDGTSEEITEKELCDRINAFDPAQGMKELYDWAYETIGNHFESERENAHE